MCTLESIEKKQNIVFPSEYKTLYNHKFAILKERHPICVNDDVFNISRFLLLSEINLLIDEFYDILGYDIIPIAETDYEDYICLYYKDSREKPSVVYLNYELAMEGDSEAVQVLYGSLSELLCKLK